MDDTDSDSGQLFDRRQGGSRRRVARFDPTINMGHILTVMTLLVGFVVAYGTYVSDRKDTEAKVAQLGREVETNRLSVNSALAQIQGDVKEMSKTVQEIGTSVEVIKARQEPRRPMMDKLP